MPRKSISGIYRIVNTVNGRVYVGSTNNIMSRRSAHFTTLEKGSHVNRKLQNAYNKYGKDKFIFDVIEVLGSDDLLISREQHWIDCLDSCRSGYNIAPIAGRNTGVVHTQETRRKVSESKKGKSRPPHVREILLKNLREKVFTPEYRMKLSIASKGRVVSDETKRKLREINLGKVLTKDHRANISAAKMGKSNGPLSEDQKKKISTANKGKKRTPEQIEALRKAITGRRLSDEHRAKLSQARAGKPRGPMSDETKRKISEVKRRNSENRREAKDYGFQIEMVY